VTVILVLAGTGNYYYPKANLSKELDTLAKRSTKRLEMNHWNGLPLLADTKTR
jgi:hypothetical protein